MQVVEVVEEDLVVQEELQVLEVVLVLLLHQDQMLIQIQVEAVAVEDITHQVELDSLAVLAVVE
jgi:hypothetical protein